MWCEDKQKHKKKNVVNNKRKRTYFYLYCNLQKLLYEDL